MNSPSECDGRWGTDALTQTRPPRHPPNCATAKVKSMSTPRSSHAGIQFQLRGTALAVVIGVAGLSFATAAPEPSSPAAPISMDRLMFVDCLLPGQMRQLGGRMPYIGPRHAVRTTVDDCEIRGGEYVAYDRA